MSRNLKVHRTIQKAARSKTNPFHIDELLNGIPIKNWRNQPNHPIYDVNVRNLLNKIPLNLSPEDTYKALESTINSIKKVIKENPDKHLNDLIF